MKNYTGKKTNQHQPANRNMNVDQNNEISNREYEMYEHFTNQLSDNTKAINGKTRSNDQQHKNII